MSRQGYKRSKQVRINFSLHRYLRIRAINEDTTVGKLIEKIVINQDTFHDYKEGMYD